MSTPDAADAAADAFLDFCERRGITEEEKTSFGMRWHSCVMSRFSIGTGPFTRR